MQEVTTHLSPEQSGDGFTEHSDVRGGATESSGSDLEGQRPLSMAEKAMEKALEDRNQSQSFEDSKTSEEQAAESDSTLQAQDTLNDPGTNDSTGETSGPEGDSTSKSQSLTPPDSWSEERRAEYNKLPDAGKGLIMSFYKDMERGLKQSFDKLATERKTLQDNFGLESDQLKALAERAKNFQTDPATVISELAEEAGIEVYFQNPEANAPIPEFESQEQLVRWLQQQSRNEARQAAANEAKTLKQQRQQEELKTNMAKEFEEAHKSHPDLADHQESIQKYILGFNIPVEMAYRLATWEGLAKLAQGGQSTQAELSKAKAELERLQKLSTMPPGRADGRSQGQRANGLDVFEHAYANAERSRANRKR